MRLCERGATKQTSHLGADRGLSGDGDHVYHCTVCFYTAQHTCMCTPLCGPACIRLTHTSTNVDTCKRRLYPALCFPFTNTFTGTQTHTSSVAKAQTLERTVSQQGDYKEAEKDPSIVSPQREVALTELVIIQSKHFSWRMWTGLHRQLTKR